MGASQHRSTASPRSPPPLRVTFSSTSRPRSRGGARRRRSTAARQHELVPRLAWIRVTALGPGATSLQNLESHLGGALARDLLVRHVASPNHGPPAAAQGASSVPTLGMLPASCAAGTLLAPRLSSRPG